MSRIRKPLDPNNPEDQKKIEFSNVEILDYNLIPNPNGKFKELCYLVRCKNCGKEFYKVKDTFGESKCYCNKQLTGVKFKESYQNISSRYFITLKHNAKIRNIEFLITRQDLWNLWLKQDGKCALTGIELTFQKSHKNMKYMTGSVDRINSDKGYTIDNIQWVLKDINIMKHVHSQEHFIEMCKKVALYNSDR